MTSVTYGDPKVDEILAEAEVYRRYWTDHLIPGQRDALLALPDSPAKAAGLARIEALLAGAPSLEEPPPPTPYVENPVRTLPGPLTGSVQELQGCRRSPYEVKELVGVTADELRSFLGEPDEIREGKFWFSNETGRHVIRAGDSYYEDEVYGPVPNIEPRRPYVIWTYAKMVGPGVPDETAAWWVFYLFVDASGRPTIVVEGGEIWPEMEF